METLSQPSSPEEGTADPFIRIYKPEAETPEQPVAEKAVTPAVAQKPAIGVQVLSPFTELLINDVRQGVGFGKVDEQSQYKILSGFGKERDLATHEITAVRAAIKNARILREEQASSPAPQDGETAQPPGSSPNKAA